MQNGFHLNDDGKIIYIKIEGCAQHICATLRLKESIFEIKNFFYFTLKALFVLEMFKF